ncbi:MAG: adenylyl-sulfate kinase [Oscillospiraceae bacterium]|nr:adenylyl-sulfate kinase [Oscillospiraceae bacterium]
MAYSLSWINDAVRSDPRGFAQESDEGYNKKIEAAARKIADNLSRSRIVLLSGPSGSGKTTTAKKIEARLKEMGINSHSVEMDNYFKTVDPETAPRNREGQIDYESPFCMDMDLLNRHFAALDRGEKILIPKFEFARQMRSDIKSQPLQLGKDEIAIFEGIHALNDIITGRNPDAAKVYISARSDILDDTGDVVFKRTWLRLERRTVRDSKFRAWKADVTVKMWANVRRGEKLYISPFKDNASIVFDSTLPYEISVIRAFAQPLFDHLRVSPDMERYEEVRHLTEAYPKFEVLDEKYVAEDSLIREFIGGGIYDD